MEYFYFARHGSAEWIPEDQLNKKSLKDVELSEKGKADALLLAETILGNKIKVDLILCSPIKRALQTAEIISKKIGVQVEIEDRIRSQDYGVWDSKKRKSREEFFRAKTNIADSFLGGESMLKVGQRIYNLLDEIKENATNKIYLLIGHDSVARVIESYFIDMTNEDFAKFGLSACELKKYYFDRRK